MRKDIAETFQQRQPLNTVSKEFIAETVHHVAYRTMEKANELAGKPLAFKVSTSEHSIKKTVLFTVGKHKQKITDIQVSYHNSVENQKLVNHPYPSFRVRACTILKCNGNVEVLSASDDFHMFINSSFSVDEKLVYLEEFLSGKLIHLRKKV